MHGDGSEVRRGRVTQGRPPARPPPLGSSAGSGGVEHERLAQREVQVHRARAGPSSAVQNARQASWRSQRMRSGVAGCVVHLEEPLRGAAVELDLVDRLPGAEVAQLRRPVGGQHEQRHARLVRLDHRGRVVRRRRARRAGERDRQARRLRQPEREEGAAALVEVRGRAQPRLARQREHERRGARPGRRARLPQPAAGELVDERAQAEVGVGSGMMSGVAPRSSSCTASRRPARAGGGRSRALGGRYRALAPGPPRPRPVAARTAWFDACAAYVRALARRPFALAGYSMGGRIALHAALDAGPRLARLVLVAPARGSPTPRSARRGGAPTTRSPTGIEAIGVEAFAREWGAQPLFAGPAASASRSGANADRLRNTPPAWPPRCAASGQA